MKKITVAIDGFSSSGKSTMARDLARRTGSLYVDSGAMYRAVTLYAIEHGMTGDGVVDRGALVRSLDDIDISFAPAGADGSQHTLLNGRDVEAEIRDMKVSSLVSAVAEIGEVRKHLVKLQQAFGAREGIVMDGRDIGTTVFPDAEMKVFVQASPEERARRRLTEMREKGEDVSFEEVLENIMERDRIDTTREISPLRRTADAHVLDNDSMTRAQQMEWLLNLYNTIANE